MILFSQETFYSQQHFVLLFSQYGHVSRKQHTN